MSSERSGVRQGWNMSVTVYYNAWLGHKKNVGEKERGSDGRWLMSYVYRDGKNKKVMVGGWNWKAEIKQK